MKNCKPSDKALNAWLDGELDASEASRLEQLLRQDPRLHRHVSELREVRSLVRRAFDAEAPSPAKSPAPRPWSPLLARALVAGLLLAVGAGFGWIMHAPAESGLDPELTASGALVLRAVQPAALASDTPNILLHISSGNPQHLRAALDETEKLLQHYQHLHRAVRLEVVANAGGINLMRANTPYAKRILELQEHYKNLTFLACRNTLALLKAKHDTQVQLLPGVRVGEPALQHVMKRLEQGWAYIKV
jgi:uncharacterized protein